MTTYRVCFRILGLTVEPVALTAEFGVAPSKGHRAGDPVPKHPERKYSIGAWTVDSPLGESTALAEHLEQLLIILAPAAEAIKTRSRTEGWTCSFYCSIFGAEPAPKGELVVVPASILGRISDLGIGLEVVLYADDG